MQVSTYVDVDVVAVEQEDVVTVMLELSAPAPASAAPRPPAAVQVVLDRSGSMHGPRLDAAKQALVRLVDRLRPSDRFGVLAFDDDVRVVAPAGELHDRDTVRRRSRASTAAVRRTSPAGCCAGCRRRGGSPATVAPRCCCCPTATPTPA